jgi:hypothetical protein
MDSASWFTNDIGEQMIEPTATTVILIFGCLQLPQLRRWLHDVTCGSKMCASHQIAADAIYEKLMVLFNDCYIYAHTG